MLRMFLFFGDVEYLWGTAVDPVFPLLVSIVPSLREKVGTGEGVPAPGVICRGVRKPSRRCYRLRESRAHPLSHPSAPRASGAGRDGFLGVTLCHPYWGGLVGTVGPGPGSPRCAARGRCCRQRAHLAAATASRCPRPSPARPRR